MASKAVAVKKEDQLALTDELMAMAMEDAGKGVSTAQEDNIVPLIYVLQALSPQCNKRGADYIEGAEPGAILLRNSNNPIVNGEEGILFQPCYFSKDWVEWVPRDAGGGYVGRHKELPPDAKVIADPKNPQRLRHVMPNGNELIETRYHIGYVYQNGVALPYVIPMTGSGHKVSRDWMTKINTKRFPNGKIMPSWIALYRLKTREAQNAAGRWFTWEVKDEAFATKEQFVAGKAVNAAFSQGEKEIEVAQREVSESSDTSAM